MHVLLEDNANWAIADSNVQSIFNFIDWSVLCVWVLFNATISFDILEDIESKRESW